MAKPLLDPVVVENGQGDRRLADSAGANESKRNELLSEIDYLLDQPVASEAGPWGQGWRFSRCARFERKIMGLPVVQIADLV